MRGVLFLLFSLQLFTYIYCFYSIETHFNAQIEGSDGITFHCDCTLYDYM